MNSSLIAELSRRRVFRAVVVYGVIAFAVLQVIEPVMHGLHWPDAVLSYIVAAIAFGFPVVVGLAWAFDVKGGAIERSAPFVATRLRRPHVAVVLAAIGVGAAAPGLIYFFEFRQAPGRADADRSVAVLPFANLSSDKENEFFADGVHSEIITQLGKISSLKVIARGSVQQYREGSRDVKAIARTLQVSTILEGSVQRAGGRVRITTQLVDATSGRQLWSESYDRDLADTFAVQTDVALDIARTLGARLTVGEKALVERAPTKDREAHDLYLRGNYYLNRGWTETDNQKGKELFERAVARDPSFAAGHALLSIAINALNQPNCVAARQHADRSLSLQPDLPEAHLALGYFHSRCLNDDAAALREYLVAMRGAPGDASIRESLGRAQIATGAEQEGLRNLRLACDLDPYSFDVTMTYAEALLDAGQFAETERALVRARALNPEDPYLINFDASLAILRDGDFEPARRSLGRFSADYNFGPSWYLVDLPEETLELLSSNRIPDPDKRAYYGAIAHFSLGHRPEAKAAFETLIDIVESHRERWRAAGEQEMIHSNLAQAYAALGRSDAADAELRNLARLTRTPQQRVEYYITASRVAMLAHRPDDAFAALDAVLAQRRMFTAARLRASRFYAPLRADARFSALLAKYGGVHSQ